MAAEKKSIGHAYNIDFLNVVFAASSIVLFVCTVWMVWDDFDREWKNTQRQFTQLEMEVTRQQLAAAEKGIDARTMQQHEQQLAAAQKNVEANQAKVDGLQRQMEVLNARLYRETQDYQFAKARYDVDRYAFEAARKAGQAGDTMKPDLDAQARRVEELDLVVQGTTAERDAVRAELGAFTGAVADIQKQIDELRTEQRRLQTRLEVIAPSLSKTFLRDAPMTDFMAPTLKVQQIMLPHIVDDVNFTRVPKMDRCTTCHLAIDRRGYEKYPQPFTTHPNLLAYVGSDSPHPLNRIGCTVCHDGMGQSVTFRDAAHTPRDEEQEHAWIEEHGWKEPHYWDYPMLPVGMTEASCAKCHREEAMVPNGPNLTLAYATYERAGCHSCHKTRGFEGLRKPGPNLTRIGSKLTPEWVKNWIREPRAIKPATWMPQIWYNSNSNSPQDAPRNEAEIDATVAYLFASSDEFAPSVAVPPAGSPASGKAIVESVGCLGCHVVEEMDRSAAGPRRTFGQPLQAVGSKTSQAWIYDWVRDPRHYSPDTYMPDLRLTDREAADVAAYLFSLKGGAGTAAKAAADQQVVDEVLFDYLKAVMPFEEARARLASLSPDEKQLELGSRAIGRYGCFGCHEIKGFEKAQPIGVELTEEASKLVTRLDFAFVDIPHTKLSWFNQKLHDPRSFDQGRVLTPNEKLRMPNFHLSDHERQLLVTAIMSFQRQIQPPAALPTAGARREFLRAGRNLTQRRNCVACHELEGNGGDYRTLVADPTLAPPLLTPEGAKVQANWLYAFLRAPITIRPWLTIRMPTFHLDDPQLNQVIGYFQAIPDQIRPFRTHDVVTASNASAGGKELFELLRCQQCHVLGAIPEDQPTANLAPDLRMAAERLNPEWIEEWLKAPARIQPGTRMPAFWPNYPKSDFPQLGNSAEAQIRAIRDHLLTFRGGPSPLRPQPPAMTADPN
ncbi:MAG: c-type cytochrome [Vicinamibacterales bacterium]